MLSKYSRPAFLFTSPWLLAAAAGLLILIVVTFAFHNLRLEQRLMTDVLVQKAATLMQVLHSGSRASYLNDLRRDYYNNESWSAHVQRVIDHMAEDPDLRFLILVDAEGKAIAHSDHAKVGQTVPVRLPQADQENGRQGKLAKRKRQVTLRPATTRREAAAHDHRPERRTDTPAGMQPVHVF